MTPNLEHISEKLDEILRRLPGSPRKVGEDGQPEKYERTHSRVWINAWNAALEEVCGLVAVNGSELDFGPFSIGHNPKRVQQEHTMIVELIRALKHPVPALRSGVHDSQCPVRPIPQASSEIREALTARRQDFWNILARWDDDESYSVDDAIRDVAALAPSRQGAGGK